MEQIENKTFEEIKVGDSASLTRTLSKRDVQLFAVITGDMNPAHLDEAYARSDIFHEIVGHGMWTGSMFSTLLGMELPGPGTVYLSQTLKFLKPVKLGDVITAKITVKSKDAEKKSILFQTTCSNNSEEKVLDGEALVLAPTQKIKWKTLPLPEVQLKSPSHNYETWLFEKVKTLKPLKTAIIHPVDEFSLRGAIDAAEAEIIEPILVGPENKIRKTAMETGINLAPYQIIPTEHSHAAAAMGVQMARNGEVEALMKGKLATEELMGAVIQRESCLRTGRRMSHVFVLDVPNYPKPLFLTDAALNISPNLTEKKDILQNAVDLFTTIGLGKPKVAVLSAVETVNEKIPSTLDATALCKMAERGQITGATVDGPLAFDNAISLQAAAIKNIHSDVAGQADILVVPDLVSGNMLYKELTYFSGAQGAGIVLGAKVPIILTSRASDKDDRVTSCALALLYTRSKHI